MAMIKQGFAASGVPPLRPWFELCIYEFWVSDHVRVKWGQSYKWAIKTRGCKVLLQGVGGNSNTLNTRSVPLVLELDHLRSRNRSTRSDESQSLVAVAISTVRPALSNKVTQGRYLKDRKGLDILDQGAHDRLSYDRHMTNRHMTDARASILRLCCS